MIKIEKLTAGYEKHSPENEILHSISLTVPRGKTSVVLGPNGSGKTTLLRTIAGFIRPWSGTIEIEGLSEDGEIARKIAFVPQSRSIPDVTVGRLVLAGRFPHTSFPHVYTKEDAKIAENAMARIGISDFAERELKKLSGGQRQKAYIAMALAQDTPILILDEPMTFLDIRQQLELSGTLSSLRDEGKTILLVAHDINAALSLADNIILMKDGNIAASGSPSTITEGGFIDSVFGVKTQRAFSTGGQLLSFSLA